MVNENASFGVINGNFEDFGKGWCYMDLNGGRYYSGVVIVLVNFISGDVVGFVVDLDVGVIWFFVNGVWFDGGDFVSGVNLVFIDLVGDIWFVVVICIGVIEVVMV